MIHKLTTNLSLFLIIFLFSIHGNAQTCQDFEVSLTSTSPAQSADGYVYLCMGDSLDIDVMGNYPNNGISYNQSDSLTDFLWFFHGGTGGAEGTTVSVAYDSPGIYPIICNAVDTAGCENTNDFVIYAIVSGPTSTELSTSLPDDSYCIGDSISLIAHTDFDSLELVYSDTVTFTYNNDSLLYLPDGTGDIFLATIDVPEFMDNSSLSLENLVVCLDIEHSYLGDLEIILTCPNGNNVILHNFSNFDGGGYYLGEPIPNSEPYPGIPATYCFSPSATNGTWLQSVNLVEQGALPPGDYSSFEPLSNLYSCSKSGDWTLSIEDLWGLDNGYLFSWSLGFVVNDSLLFEDVVFDSIQYLPVLTDQYWELPDGSIVNSAEIAVEATSNSIYTYTATNEMGCEFSYEIEMQPNMDSPCNPCIPYSVTDTAFVICQGDTIQYLGSSFSQTGNYSVIPDSTYCQNPVAVTVTVDATSMPADTIFTICQGDTVLLAGETITMTGIYQIASPQEFLPCFPTYTATVNVIAMPLDTVFTICQGDTVLLGGETITMAGTYQIASPQESLPCFPTYTATVLECNSCMPYPVTDTTFAICQGDTIQYLGSSFSQAGNYSVMPDSIYCQNPVAVTVLVNSLDYTIVTTPTLLGTAEGIIEVTTVGYYIDNGDTLSILNDLAAGFHDIVITDGTCSEMITVEILDFTQLLADVTVSENFTGSSTFTVTVNISGGWPEYIVEWSTGDIGADVSLPDLEAGEYWVKVTDALGNEVIHHFTAGSVSNEDLSHFESVNVYPNPTSHMLNIEVSFNEIHDYDISLYNILGERIFMMSGAGKKVSENQDLKLLSQGIYLLEISANGNSWVEKITIQ